jgi:hypothetical protein
LIFTSIIVLIFSAAGVYAATMDSSNSTTIYACQTNQTGLLHVVDVNTACKNNETKLFWNVVGPKGDKGDIGATGATGIAGPQGPAGKDGAVGPQGTQGPKGDTGAQGVAGLIGPQGVKGDTGAVGPQGLAGPFGPMGPAGAKGDTGAQGVAGLIGLQGVKGDTGAVGPQGPAGVNGKDGAQGPAGPVKSISGMVFGYAPTANINFGSGFTVERVATGKYIINFPAGTWTHQPVITVTPFGNQVSAHIAGYANLNNTGVYDGSASYAINTVIYTSANTVGYEFIDASFNFVAVETQ